jgi:hypothetical protein
MSAVPWPDFDLGGLNDPGPQSESPTVPGSIDPEWGRSESLDPDNVGDIADEGVGHRG